MSAYHASHFGEVRIHSAWGGVWHFADLTSALIFLGEDDVERLEDGRLGYPTLYERRVLPYTEHYEGGDAFIVLDDCGCVIAPAILKELFWKVPESLRSAKQQRHYSYNRRSRWGNYTYACNRARPEPVDRNFRSVPVSYRGIRRRRGSYRGPQTFSEISANSFLHFDEETSDHMIVGRRAVGSDLQGYVPTRYSDIHYGRRSDGWKAYRRYQRRAQ